MPTRTGRAGRRASSLPPLDEMTTMLVMPATPPTIVPVPVDVAIAAPPAPSAYSVFIAWLWAAVIQGFEFTRPMLAKGFDIAITITKSFVFASLTVLFAGFLIYMLCDIIVALGYLLKEAIKQAIVSSVQWLGSKASDAAAGTLAVVGSVSATVSCAGLALGCPHSTLGHVDEWTGTALPARSLWSQFWSPIDNNEIGRGIDQNHKAVMSILHDLTLVGSSTYSLQVNQVKNFAREARIGADHIQQAQIKRGITQTADRAEDTLKAVAGLAGSSKLAMRVIRSNVKSLFTFLQHHDKLSPKVAEAIAVTTGATQREIAVLLPEVVQVRDIASEALALHLQIRTALLEWAETCQAEWPEGSVWLRAYDRAASQILDYVWIPSMPRSEAYLSRRNVTKSNEAIEKLEVLYNWLNSFANQLKEYDQSLGSLSRHLPMRMYWFQTQATLGEAWFDLKGILDDLDNTVIHSFGTPKPKAQHGLFKRMINA